jgi:hypothetical protein
MKNLYVCILALGLGNAIINAADVKQSAAQAHKYNDAATLALTEAFVNLDLDGVITALNNGANPNARIGTKSHKLPEGDRTFEYFVSTNPEDTACLYYLVHNALINPPHELLPSGVPAQKAFNTILNTVITHGGDINVSLHDRGNHGSPLHLAINEGYYKETQLSVMKALIHAGADINNQMDVSHSTPIQDAAYRGQIDAFKLLLYSGADTTLRNSNNHDLNYTISISTLKSELLKILDEYTKTARHTVQREATPHITRDPASLAADYVVGESEERLAIHKSKEPKEDEDEE